jgi:hypothetical protein
LLKKSKLFDRKWYLTAYPDVKEAKCDPILHFLIYGWKENRNPCALFITKLYLKNNPDVKKAQVNPLIHYIRYGKKEGRCIGYNLSEYKRIHKSNFFDKQWYLENYKDALAAKMDPIIHYLLIGWKKGYNPSHKFNTNFYLNNYPDIVKANLCPLLHYVRYGYKEGRIISNGCSENAISLKNFGLLSSFSRSLWRRIYAHTIKENRNTKIAVHLHLFYEKLWPEIKHYLKNLSCYQFDLYITTPKTLSSTTVNDILECNKKTKIWIVENRGFDLGPFIYFLHRIDLQKYDLLFKIHTKRDVVPKNYYGLYLKGNEWRTLLYEGILGAKTVHEVINYLSEDNEIGLVANKNLISTQDMMYNKEETIRIMKMYNFKIPEKYVFIAGTMFAGKTKLFKNVKEKLDFDDFLQSQRGEFTLAHAFERILSLNILSQGFTVKGTTILHWKSIIRKIQTRLHPYNPIFFYNNEMIKNYLFYQVEAQKQHKKFIISSLLKEKNRKLYDVLIKKSRIELDRIQPLSNMSFGYHFLLKEMITDRVVAKIISPIEITRFKLIGDEISVEKESKQKSLNILKVCNQSPQFITQGKYLLEVLEKPLFTKNTKKLIRELVPYCLYVFKVFKSKHPTKLSPNSWDAIPRNTIINAEGKFCFFDCNIHYLAGVSKSYFVYRVIADLISYAAANNIIYSSSEILTLYNLLCQNLNICGDFRKNKELEHYLQQSLFGKISNVQFIKDLVKIICFQINILGMFGEKEKKRTFFE